MENDFDVIVIGAGIMGSCAAYQTAKRGRRTLLLEQFDFLHHLGSSHGESRTLRAAYGKDYYGAMVIESCRLWREAETEAGYRVYTPTPQLDMWPADCVGLRAVVASCQRNSVSCEILDHEGVDKEFSGKISIPEGWIAVRSEIGGIVKPTKAVSMFQALALKWGAILRDRTEVKDIKRDEGRGGVLVYSSKGDMFWGRKCIVAAGAWIAKLVGSFSGIHLPIQPLEVNVLYWRIKDGHEEGYSVEGGFPTFSSHGDPHVFGTPSLEFPGMMKIMVHGGHPCNPDKRSWKLAEDIDVVKYWIEGRFPGIRSTEPTLTQSCMYTMTPDEDFVVDFLGGEFGKDVVLGGGFSGHGFKMAPVIGRVLADLALTGAAQEEALGHLRLARFKSNP
ncbi:hypothetical protein MLD38_028596 [Melastoma candidum]|uniref:Uncharacterized protein n=1 Tax=Melastoma candidum TaxID=119954 RepID=A0ACB9N325_9MYRT|nr:hypothetical protein MLD38_028596 [Melastoma candidum]